jgi:hypothetical protein
MKHLPAIAFALGFMAAPRAAARALPTVSCSSNQVLECVSSNGAPAVVQALVHDIDGSPLTVLWLVNRRPVATNSLPPFVTTNAILLTLTNTFRPGTNEVLVWVSEGGTNTVMCSSTVIARDSTPPAMIGLTATPRVLWPPNHRMVPIRIDVRATDACGPVTWRVTSIQSSEAVDARGSGHTSPDWIIGGPHRAAVRAERAGPGPGRIYTIGVDVADPAGNSTNSTVRVYVPHDQGHGLP